MANHPHLATSIHNIHTYTHIFYFIFFQLTVFILSLADSIPYWQYLQFWEVWLTSCGICWGFHILIYTAPASRKYSSEMRLSAVEIYGCKIQLIGVWLVICRIWWGLRMLISAAVANSKYNGEIQFRYTVDKHNWDIWMKTHTWEIQLSKVWLIICLICWVRIGCMLISAAMEAKQTKLWNPQHVERRLMQIGIFNGMIINVCE